MVQGNGGEVRGADIDSTDLRGVTHRREDVNFV